MSPPAQPAQTAQIAKTQDQPFEQMQIDQPRAHQHMSMSPNPVSRPGQTDRMIVIDPQQAHPDVDQVTMRGGNRGGPCPGRFCFCIPCPFPCDFCII